MVLIAEFCALQVSFNSSSKWALLCMEGVPAVNQFIHSTASYKPVTLLCIILIRIKTIILIRGFRCCGRIVDCQPCFLACTWGTYKLIGMQSLLLRQVDILVWEDTTLLPTVVSGHCVPKKKMSKASAIQTHAGLTFFQRVLLLCAGVKLAMNFCKCVHSQTVTAVQAELHSLCPKCCMHASECAVCCDALCVYAYVCV